MTATMGDSAGRLAVLRCLSIKPTTFIRICPYCGEGRARVPSVWNNRKKTVTFAHRRCLGNNVAPSRQKIVRD